MKLAAVVSAFLVFTWFRPSLQQQQQRYNAIFNFGDSISDTGNLCVGGCPSWLTLGQSPYGETFFGHPTGRCSDGRVIVDFLAEEFGLQMLPPSKAYGSNFKQGANMAIIGATAMDSAFFNSIGVGDKIWNNGPLATQIQWFENLVPSICSTYQECKDYLGKSLFIVGEFGGNDYNAPLFNGQSIDTVSSYVPRITQAIADGVEKLIQLGAVDLVVPGVLPIGCSPIYITLFETGNEAEYDYNGCLRKFNDLSSYHNYMLREALNKVQVNYPWARIMYADLDNQFQQMVQSPESFGLKYGLRVCCGASGQGRFNYNNQARCGMQGSSACADPYNYLVWDGIHLTEAAYRSIANAWLRGPFCEPPILFH